MTIKTSLLPTLISIYTTALLLRGFLATKIITIAGVHFPAGLVAFPLSFICNDIFSEVYGFRKTKAIIAAGLIAQTLTFVLVQVAIALPGATFWTGDDAFNAILGQSLRVTFASLVAYYFGELTNSYVLSYLRRTGQHFNVVSQAKRFVLSTLWGELVDSVLFIGVAFYGVHSFDKVLHLIITTWLLKSLYEVIFLPFSIPLANYIRCLENEETVASIQFVEFESEKSVANSD